MQINYIFFTFALGAIVERDKNHRPLIPILTLSSIEQRKDSRYILDIEQMEYDEAKHLRYSRLSVENPEDFYLFHQQDYLTLFDRKRNQPQKIFATVAKKSTSTPTYRFHEKRIDPRSKVWNNYRTPFFHPSLTSSPKNSIDSWISSNMVDVDFIGWEIFTERILLMLIDDKGDVNLVMENKLESIFIQLIFINQPNQPMHTFSIEKIFLASNQFRTEPLKVFKTILNGQLSVDDVESIWQDLNKKKKLKKNERYVTWKPINFLCMNEGQYAPWWNEADFHWNRCKSKYGENIDKRPDEADIECYCDDNCMLRKDCCTDYLQSCKGQNDGWGNTECETELNQCSFQPVTLLISTDGFRKSYLEERAEFIPNYLKLRTCGPAMEMQASYPSKTFPNHYTLATGLHPSQHGIVDNDWFDWKRNASCSVFSDRSAKSYPCAPMSDAEGWYGGDPIWNTVERHGQIAACCLWTGSDLEINGQRPSYSWSYDDKGEGPFAERIYQVLKWLQLPQWDGINESDKTISRPSFITLYFDEPDHAGHAFGPDDKTGEVNRALKRVDVVLGMLMDGLKMYGLDHCVNIVLTSDHGMERGVCDDVIEVFPPSSDLKGEIYVKSKSTSTVIGATKDNGLNNKTWGSDFDIGEVLSRYQCNDALSLRAFDKYNLPKRLHYSATSQIESIHLLMNLRNKSTTSSTCNDAGYIATHGWDNKYPEMQVPVSFYGPDFKNNVDETDSASIQNIEIYKILLDLLKISSESKHLMPEVIDQQFSEWGKFSYLLKNPLASPKSDQTAYKRPSVDASTGHFEVSSNLIIDKRTVSAIFMTKRHLANFDFGVLEKPFWWSSLLEILNTIKVENPDDEFNFQFGTIFDVSGEGYYVDPDDWIDGRLRLSGVPGCQEQEVWCNINGQPIPTHFYVIIRPKYTAVFSAILPWQNSQRFNANCRVANKNECRESHAADFGCQQTNLASSFWMEKMDLYSAKVIEIERLTNLKFFQDETIPPELSVKLRTHISEFGDFKTLLPDSAGGMNIISLLLLTAIFVL